MTNATEQPKTTAQRLRDLRADDSSAMLTIEEFCAHVGINVVTFHRRREQMPATIRVGKAVRIPRSALEQWEREQLKREQRRQRARPSNDAA